MAAETDRGYPDRALEIAQRIGSILEVSTEARDRRRLGILACNAEIALELQGDYEAALVAYGRWQEIVREITPDDEGEITRADQNRALALTKLDPFYWAPFCLTGADGVVGAAGLMRAVRRIVKCGKLSPAIRGIEIPDTDEGETPVLPIDRVVLTGTQSQGVYEGIYAGFTEEGVYRLVAYAWDNDRNLSLPCEKTVGERKVYLPLILR